MVAVHSIEYNSLRSYFYLFSVYDTAAQAWLPWPEVPSLAAVRRDTVVTRHATAGRAVGHAAEATHASGGVPRRVPVAQEDRAGV